MLSIKKNVVYNTLLTTSNLILPLITFPYVNRILAPQGIGLVNFANSFILYFIIISSLGIPIYGIREIAKVRDKGIELRSQIFIELFLIRLVCSVISIIIYVTIILLIPKFEDTLIFYYWGICLIVLNIFDVNYFFSAIENFKYITIRTILFQVISVVLTFLLIKSKDDVFIYFLIPIGITFLNTIVNIKYIFKFIVIRRFDINLLRHIKPLIFLFSVLVFSSIYNLLDITLLGFWKSDEVVGFYSIVTKLNKVPLAIIMLLTPVLIPRISNEYGSSNYPEIERLVSKATLFVITIGVPIMIGIFVLSKEIVLLFGGAEYYPSINTLKILSPVPLIIGLTTCFSNQILVPLGKDKHLLIIVLLGALISITFNCIFIPYLAQNGAAISNLIAEFTVLVLCFTFASKELRVTIPIKELLLYIVICTPFGIFYYILSQFTLMPVFLIIITFLLSSIYYLLVQKYLVKNVLLIDLLTTIKKFFKNKICHEN